MSEGRRWLERFWFCPAPAARLALLRILIGGYALWYVGQRYSMFIGIAGARKSLFEPVGVAALLDGPISPALLRAILGVTIALNVAFIAGFRFRVVGPLFAGFLLFVLSYRNSWSMIYHSQNLVVLHVIVLGLTPAANALSLDVLGRSKWGGSVLWRLGTWPTTESATDWRYGWPIRLICSVTALSYFLAGAAKVLGEVGWSWGTGEALRSYITRDGLRKELLADGASPLVSVVSEHVGLLTIIAVMSLVLELGAPLVLVNPRAARVWAILAFGMHWGIFFIMGIRFRYQLSGIAFAPFFDIEKLGRLFRRGRRS